MTSAVRSVERSIGTHKRRGLKGSVVNHFVCSVAFLSFQYDVNNDELTTWLSRPIGGLDS